MNVSSLIFCAALASSGVALAQNSTNAQGSASARSSTSVSADRSGAAASHDSAASAAATSDHASAGAAQGMEMNATLSRSVDTRNAKPGDEVRATLAHDVESGGQVMFRRGTTLVGHVTEAKPRDRHAEGGGDSRLGIVFERAVLKDGSEVPVNATIRAVAAAEAAALSGQQSIGSHAAGGGVGGAARGTLDGASAGAVQGSAGAVGGLNAAGSLMSGRRGAFGMHGVDLASAAAGSAQGSVLTSRTDNVALGRG